MAQKGAVIISQSFEFLRLVCDAGVVIEDGRAVWFDDVETETAIEAPLAVMA